MHPPPSHVKSKSALLFIIQYYYLNKPVGILYVIMYNNGTYDLSSRLIFYFDMYQRASGNLQYFYEGLLKNHTMYYEVARCLKLKDSMMARWPDNLFDRL